MMKSVSRMLLLLLVFISSQLTFGLLPPDGALVLLPKSINATNLEPEELDIIKYKMESIVKSLDEFVGDSEQKNTNLDSNILHDDPFDQQPSRGDEVSSMRELIAQWNRLVYSNNFDIDSDEMDSEKVMGRSSTAGCSNSCHPYSSCLNKQCVCNKGFTGDGINNCEDIDECKTLNICGTNQVCLNLFSSFNCRCKSGYKADNKTGVLHCEDINECKDGIHTCHNSAICLNIDGSYKCECDVGFIMDLQQHCQKKVLPPILDCKPDKIEINITKSHLEVFKPTLSGIALKPGSMQSIFLQPNENSFTSDDCILKQSDTSESYILSLLPPFTLCGTSRVIEHNATNLTIYFKNTIWWSVSPKNLPFIMMSYKMYDFECKFPLNIKDIGRKATTEVKTPRHQTTEGEGNITMKFWRIPPWQPFSEPSLTLPTEYAIGEILYVTVELGKDHIHQDSSILQLDDCYLSANPATVGPRVNVISNECLSNGIFEHGVLINGKSNVAMFYFQMLKFKQPGINVHCDVTLCKTTCKQTCSNGRKKRSSSTEASASDNAVNSDKKKLKSLSEGPIYPVETEKEENEKDKNRNKKKPEPTKRIVLPIVLIAANIAILTLLGLLSYALAKSVTSRRRANQRTQDRVGLVEETIGQVSFSPPTPPRTTETPSGKSCSSQPKKFAYSHSFCQDKNCQFMKDIKGKSQHGFWKNSKKQKRQQLKESMFKPIVYDTSTLTCPTPFNSPPPSPPIEDGPAVTSVGTSPIRVYNEGQIQRSVSKSSQSDVLILE